MPILTTTSKVQEFFESQVLSELKNWTTQLIQGDLLGFEQSLSNKLVELNNHICEELLPQAADQSFEDLKEQSKAQGCRKIARRPLQIRLCTGHFVQVESPYVKQVADDYQGARHLLNDHWHLIGQASPLLYDRVGFCAALSPSFEAGYQLLGKFNVCISRSSVQKLTLQLAERCQQVGEARLSLNPTESVAGKTVIVGIDGGRTRTRQYLPFRNRKRNLCYDTPWREPKLFVIDIIGDDGKVDRQELPIYGTRFDQQDLFELLRQYFQRLDITQARHVQIIGDGAPWIWNNLKPVLLELGVAEDRITETLDVWHGTQYVHKLIENMGSRKTKPEKRKLKKQFLNWLWGGQSNKIVERCRAIYKRQSDVVRRYITYLDKHVTRSQYADYKLNGLMCGSGIVESAIRRVINLRFKNAATFWHPENVEKMYFLRASVLSGRWNMVIQNLQI